MHQTIWKYPFEVTDHVAIEMPEGAVVLDAQVLDGKPCLWAIVHPGNSKKARNFHLVATGSSIETFERGRYIATFQTPATSEVWHLFEAT